MEPFKNIYSRPFFEKLSTTLIELLPYFDKKGFMNQIFTPEFEAMELKERMRHTSLTLHQHLPKNFAEAMDVFDLMIDRFRQSEYKEDHLVFIFLPDYIEVYGIDDFDTSTKAFEKVTQFITCEFAVRPFILRYGDQMIGKMTQWSLHDSPQLRRLSTEGCRPRLPWAMALPFLKVDPKPILPILENLKTDADESVRRSVANNLNDIAKDNPDIVIKIAKRWQGTNKETDSIVKHGCRTLLKQAQPEILELYGLSSDNIHVENLQIKNPNVKIGDNLTFTFDIDNRQNKEQIIRLEYGLYYQKANGTLSRKVFKISERLFQPFEKANIKRNQSFKIITTRRFHLGEHQVSIIANGAEMAIEQFELIKTK